MEHVLSKPNILCAAENRVRQMEREQKWCYYKLFTVTVHLNWLCMICLAIGIFLKHH